MLEHVMPSYGKCMCLINSIFTLSLFLPLKLHVKTQPFSSNWRCSNMLVNEGFLASYQMCAFHSSFLLIRTARISSSSSFFFFPSKIASFPSLIHTSQVSCFFSFPLCPLCWIVMQTCYEVCGPYSLLTTGAFAQVMNGMKWT